MSYYLTYRPQKVAELDLESARAAFGRILASGTFAHAYLLTGPKGTGKTSSARILAKVFNCDLNREGLLTYRSTGTYPAKLSEPCGTCLQCTEITKGSSLAVIEMDAASNRGIDDVRQLRERIGLAPAMGVITTYVIDEVHMLTTEAFNALLKTLEEPPRHAVFVLCTTEAHKIPDTIHSRCTRVAFTQASTQEVKQSLLKAVKGEHLKIDDAVLTALAARVDGSFRDGMKLLEQLAQIQGEIGMAQLDLVTGHAKEYDPESFYQAVVSRDVDAALHLLLTKQEQGIDFGVFGTRVLEYMHSRLTEAIKKDQATLREVSQLMDHFAYYQTRYRKPVLQSIPLEIASVLWCTKEFHPSEVITQKETEPSHLKPKGKQADSKRSEKNTNGSESIGNMKVSEVPETIVKKSNSTTAAPLKLEEVREQWSVIMRKVKPFNHSLEALLRAAEPELCEDEWLQLKVYYAFHKEQLEQERYRTILEEVMSAHMGTTVKLRFNLGDKAQHALAEDSGINNVTGKVDEHVAAAAEEIFG